MPLYEYPMRRLRAPLRANSEIFRSARRRVPEMRRAAGAEAALEPGHSVQRIWLVYQRLRAQGLGSDAAGKADGKDDKPAGTDAKAAGTDSKSSSSDSIPLLRPTRPAPRRRRPRRRTKKGRLTSLKRGTTVRRSIFSERRYARKGSLRSGRLSAKYTAACR